MEEEERLAESYNETQSLTESTTDDEAYNEARTQQNSEEVVVEGTQNDTIEITERGGGTANNRIKSLMQPTVGSETEAGNIPLNSLNRVHSPKSRSINEALDHMFEQLCKPLYEELMQDPKGKEAYCKFKNYTLKPVSDKDMRYHRVLGQGAFGTVYGCMISHVGRMMAMKIMVKKKVKFKKAKSQVSAERDALMRLAVHPSPYCMQVMY